MPIDGDHAPKGKAEGPTRSTARWQASTDGRYQDYEGNPKKMERELGGQILSVLGVPPVSALRATTGEMLRERHEEEVAHAVPARGEPFANHPRTREAGVVVKTGYVRKSCSSAQCRSASGR